MIYYINSSRSECHVNFVFAGGDNSSEVEKPDTVCAPSVTASKVSQSAMGKQAEDTTDGLVVDVSLSDRVKGATNASLTAISPGLKDAMEEERSFTFDVSPLVGVPERETIKGWQSVSSTEAGKKSTVVLHYV